MSDTQKHTKPNVPNLRFPGFSDEWKKSTLKEECIVNPKTEGLEKEFLYIDLESVVKGQLVKQNIISRDEAPSRAQRVLSKWDIIYQCVRPYQLNNYIIRDESTIQLVASTGYAQIRTKHNPDFIYQLLHTKGFTDQVINRCTGTNYPAINSTDLSSIEINFPSIQEQAKIGELLTIIDQRIAIQSKVIERYQSLIRAITRTCFHGENEYSQIPLSEIAPNIASGKSKPSAGKYPLYGSTGIIGTCSSDAYKGEMILVARVGSIGQIQLINTSGCGITDNTLIIDSGELNRYVYFFLKTFDFQKITSGTTQPLITGGSLKRISVPILPATKRSLFISLLSAVEQRIELEQELLQYHLQSKTYVLANMFI